MKKDKKILFLIFMITIAISIFLFSYGSDFFWHLKVGEYISTKHKIPFTDIFSWYGSENHLHWISHEWLFEVLIYQIFRFGKQFGIFLYVLCTLFLMALILWKQNKEKFLEYPFQTIIWGIMGMLIFANKTMPRPHLISYIFFALTIYIAYDTIQNKNSKKIYFAPFISFLWSNTHGGSSNLSYIVYGIFLTTGFFTFSNKYIKNKKLERTQIKKFLYAFFSSILMICINPHGYQMLYYPYLNMTYQTMISCIEEWQSLNIFQIDGCFYFLWITSMTICIFRSKKKSSFRDLMLLLIFTIVGIKSTRLMPYLYIVATSIIPNYWQNKQIKIKLLPILISLLCIIFIFYLRIYQPPNFHIISKEIVQYLKKENRTIYNSYELGGYLIYQEIPVFIDGRADLYIDTILCDVCNIEQGKKLALLDKYPFDTFIVKKDSKIEAYLKENQKYKLKLKDQNNSLYILK